MCLFNYQDNSQTYRSRQGNSIFAEVEDRRLEVESRLEKATARLRVADEVKRRLRSQLNECYVSMQLLAKYTSKADQKYKEYRNSLTNCLAIFCSRKYVKKLFLYGFLYVIKWNILEKYAPGLFWTIVKKGAKIAEYKTCLLVSFSNF